MATSNTIIMNGMAITITRNPDGTISRQSSAISTSPVSSGSPMVNKIKSSSDNKDTNAVANASSGQDVLFKNNLDIYGKFNVNQLRDSSYDYAIGGRWYVFMLRPCCNVSNLVKTNRFAYYLDNAVNKSTGIGSNGASSGLNKLGKYLLAMLYDLPEEIAEKKAKAGNTANFSSHFMPLITNLAKGFEPVENSLEVLQVNDTLNGYKHAFVKHDVNAVGANTLNISYSDLEGYPITNLHFAWYEYMKRIRDGSTSMSSVALKKRIVDYPTSLYYFQLAPDGVTLNYWCKYTGIFPTTAPFNIYKGGSDSGPAEVQISYQYVKKDDMDPVVLKEFNDAVNGIFPEMDQEGGFLKKIFMSVSKVIKASSDAIYDFAYKESDHEQEVASAQDEIERAEANIYRKFYGKYSISEINDPKNLELFRSKFPAGFDRLENAKAKKTAIEQNYNDKEKSKETEDYVSEWFGTIKTYPGNLRDYSIGEGGNNYDPFFQSTKPQIYKIQDEAGNSKLALLFD